MGNSQELGDSVEVSHEVDVLVVGGGPVGMIMAYQLARSDISCMMVEQELQTTTHPKMEFLSSRSMEIFQRIGIAERLRPIAVPERHGLNEVFSTGLDKKGINLRTLARDSPDVLRKKYVAENDGSHPREPWLRISQIVFEAWMKPICQADALIDDRWGWTFSSLDENEDHVLSRVTDVQGRNVRIKSKYVIGCDGAGSRVRSAAKLESKRKATPLHIHTIHFRSRDFKVLHSQGEFWHLNLLTGSVVISQDEIETFTYHEILPPGSDEQSILNTDPVEVLKKGLGGIGEPCEIEIEEILNTSLWRSYLSIADAYRSTNGRVLLAGDAAHQLSPVGGHGLNSGIGDTFDLCWKLASVLKGYGGEHLLASYDYERRNVGLKNVQHVEEAISYFLPLFSFADSVGRDVIIADNDAGRQSRSTFMKMIDDARWIHQQVGNWVDYRYTDSPIVVPQLSGNPPPREATKYIPVVWPGSRAPHVYLGDGKSIFDLFGSGFNLLDFTPQGEISALFRAAAEEMHIPINCLGLSSEKHAASIYKRDAVLVRPDGHVTWCTESGSSGSMNIGKVKEIMAIAIGNKPSLPKANGHGVEELGAGLLQASISE